MPTTYTDTKPEADETVKIIEKEYTIPESTETVTIDMEAMINTMNEAEEDITSILKRFNNAREVYNEALVGLKSTTTPLAEATASFPKVPETVTE